MVQNFRKKLNVIYARPPGWHRLKNKNKVIKEWKLLEFDKIVYERMLLEVKNHCFIILCYFSLFCVIVDALIDNLIKESEKSVNILTGKYKFRISSGSELFINNWEYRSRYTEYLRLNFN